MTQTLERPTVRVARRTRRKPWWLIPFALVWLLILAFMLTPYLPPDIRTSRVPMDGDQVHFWLLWTHIATAAVATVTGFAQFWPWLRRRHPQVHRWTGRAYFFLGVFPSMVLAVPVALLSQFGVANIGGLLALDAMWIWTAVAGYRAARQGRYPDHRRWMIRNFAVLLASLSSRLWQVTVGPIAFALADSPMYRGDEQTIIHDTASLTIWAALLTNMVIAEIYLARKYPVRPARAARAVAADRGAVAPRTPVAEEPGGCPVGRG